MVYERLMNGYTASGGRGSDIYHYNISSVSDVSIVHTNGEGEKERDRIKEGKGTERRKETDEGRGRGRGPSYPV